MKSNPVLWPALADKMKRKKDDGRAEAALVAYWYQQKESANGVFS